MYGTSQYVQNNPMIPSDSAITLHRYFLFKMFSVTFGAKVTMGDYDFSAGILPSYKFFHYITKVFIIYADMYCVASSYQLTTKDNKDEDYS